MHVVLVDKDLACCANLTGLSLSVALPSCQGISLITIWDSFNTGLGCQCLGRSVFWLDSLSRWTDTIRMNTTCALNVTSRLYCKWCILELFFLTNPSYPSGAAPAGPGLPAAGANPEIRQELETPTIWLRWFRNTIKKASSIKGNLSLCNNEEIYLSTPELSNFVLSHFFQGPVTVTYLHLPDNSTFWRCRYSACLRYCVIK